MKDYKDKKKELVQWLMEIKENIEADKISIISYGVEYGVKRGFNDMLESNNETKISILIDETPLIQEIQGYHYSPNEVKQNNE